MKTKTQVIKSPSVRATYNKFGILEVDPSDPEAIINATYAPVKENSYTTVIPILSEATANNQTSSDFSGAVQLIVLEFDDCPLVQQKERAEFLAKELRTPMATVYSGNKSYHTYLWFQRFASTPDEYKKICSNLVQYLAKKYPNYFQTKDGSDKKLIPDYKMFESSRYCRQANGRNSETEKIQEFKELISLADIGTPLDLIELLGKIKEQTDSQPKDTEGSRSKDDLRRSTYKFIASGSEKGNRDDDCFKAASDLRDCGFTKEEALEMLLEGSDKCSPPFPKSEVKLKIKSAYSYESNQKKRKKFTCEELKEYGVYCFIEPTTGSYYYTNNGKLYSASLDILKKTLESYNMTIPDPFPILEFKYDVHDFSVVDEKAGSFNLFVPTEYMLLDKDDEKIIPDSDFPSIHKLLINLFPSDEEREHFINWFSTVFNTRDKQLTAWVLKGAQGSGKTLFLNNVIKPLFGEKQAIQVEDEQLKSQFNGWMKNTCFICFNEVASNNGERNKVNSKIKAIVTDSRSMINEKHVKTYFIENSVNCMFYSNERVPILVEQDDRRFNIIETGGKLVKLDWFDINTAPNMIVEEVQRFAQYLINYNYDEEQAKTVLENQSKKDVVAAGLDSFEEFTLRLKSNDHSWLEENINQGVPPHSEEYIDDPDQIRTINGKIEKKFAFKLFSNIYNDKNIKQITLTKQLKLCGITSSRIQFLGDRILYYVWNE